MYSGRSEGGKSVASERSQSNRGNNNGVVNFVRKRLENRSRFNLNYGTKILLILTLIIYSFFIGSIHEIKKKMVQEKKDWDNIVRRWRKRGCFSMIYIKKYLP